MSAADLQAYDQDEYEAWRRTFVQGTPFQMTNPVANILHFRKFVQSLKDSYAKAVIMLNYLTATRASEAVNITPEDVYVDDVYFNGNKYRTLFISIIQALFSR